MEIVHSKLEDVDTIIKIYDIARKYMRDNGNYSQWINGYPSKEQIINDINNNVSYVVKENNIIVAVFVFIIGIDNTYINIENGNWHSNNTYGVIHRIASEGSVKEITNFVFNWCLNSINYLRIDTHKDNLIMQHCVTKFGFKCCGIIHVADGSPRLAYDYIRE